MKFIITLLLYFVCSSVVADENCFNVTLEIQNHEADGSSWETLIPWGKPDVKICVLGNNYEYCRVQSKDDDSDSASCKGLICEYKALKLRPGNHIILTDVDKLTPDDPIGQGVCSPPSRCRLGVADLQFTPVPNKNCAQ